MSSQYSTDQYEECQGCSVHEAYGQCLVSPRNKYGNTCPCIKCLVKSMCRDACEEWLSYRDKDIKNAEIK